MWSAIPASIPGLNCFAESETQASEASQMRPHAQIGAFDVRRADARFVRVSADYDGNGCRDFRRLIPVWPFSVTRSVQLHELSEINIGSEIFFDGGNITTETVRRKLKSPGEVVRNEDRKSTRLNSSHSQISYAVFCLKKKKK